MTARHRCRPYGHHGPFEADAFRLFCVNCWMTETGLAKEYGLNPIELSTESRAEIRSGLGQKHRNSIFPALCFAMRRYQLRTLWWHERPVHEVRRDGQRLLQAVAFIRKYLAMDRLEGIWFRFESAQVAAEKANLVRFTFEMLEEMGQRDAGAQSPPSDFATTWPRRELEDALFRALALHSIPLGGIRAARVLAVVLEAATGVRPADPPRTLAHARTNALDYRFRPTTTTTASTRPILRLVRSSED